jgi:hypothetical protein
MTRATPEPALREAGQGLILQEGFEVGDKRCANCQSFEKVVWFSTNLDHSRCGLCRTSILPAAARATAKPLFGGSCREITGCRGPTGVTGSAKRRSIAPS